MSAGEYMVHERIPLGTDDNGDKYRDSTVLCESAGDDVSLWFDSLGLAFRILLTPEQAKHIAAALLKAVAS